MYRLLAFLALVWLTGIPAVASSFYVVPDVPTTLSGSTYLPWTALRNDSGTYSVALTLPVNTHINALHRLDSGGWLFSVEAPTTLGGSTYDPRDVIRYNGTNYSLFWSGAAAGLPTGSNVDALSLAGDDARGSDHELRCPHDNLWHHLRTC